MDAKTRNLTKASCFVQLYQKKLSADPQSLMIGLGSNKNDQYFLQSAKMPSNFKFSEPIYFC